MKATLDIEDFAMLLAASATVNKVPTTKAEIAQIWAAKEPETQYAYRLRAQRMLKAWTGPRHVPTPTKKRSA
jgi:hypothetical protein